MLVNHKDKSAFIEFLQSLRHRRLYDIVSRIADAINRLYHVVKLQFEKKKKIEFDI